MAQLADIDIKADIEIDMKKPGLYRSDLAPLEPALVHTLKAVLLWPPGLVQCIAAFLDSVGGPWWTKLNQPSPDTTPFLHDFLGSKDKKISFLVRGDGGLFLFIDTSRNWWIAAAQRLCTQLQYAFASLNIQQPCPLFFDGIPKAYCSTCDAAFWGQHYTPNFTPRFSPPNFTVRFFRYSDTIGYTIPTGFAFEINCQHDICNDERGAAKSFIFFSDDPKVAFRVFYDKQGRPQLSQEQLCVLWGPRILSVLPGKINELGFRGPREGNWMFVGDRMAPFLCTCDIDLQNKAIKIELIGPAIHIARHCYDPQHMYVIDVNGCLRGFDRASQQQISNVNLMEELPTCMANACRNASEDCVVFFALPAVRGVALMYESWLWVCLPKRYTRTHDK
jgi:hypothetical protein